MQSLVKYIIIYSHWLSIGTKTTSLGKDTKTTGLGLGITQVLG